MLLVLPVFFPDSILIIFNDVNFDKALYTLLSLVQHPKAMFLMLSKQTDL